MNKFVETEIPPYCNGFAQPVGELFFISCCAQDTLNIGIFAEDYEQAVEAFICGDSFLCGDIAHGSGKVELIVQCEKYTRRLVVQGYGGLMGMDITFFDPSKVKEPYDMNVPHPYFEKMKLKVLSDVVERLAKSAEKETGDVVSEGEKKEVMQMLITAEFPT